MPSMTHYSLLEMSDISPSFKYFAFISYSSKDIEWGKRLQRKLEHYRMPATLCSERGWMRTPIKPVFFAPTDIQPGGLTEELQERLKASRNLIVICSPNSAKSEWVGKEIEYFHQLGRTKSIHFFIVDGNPHSNNLETECFNPIVEKLGLPELLGANIHERIYRWPWLNKERAYVQLVSKLLSVEFDTIWQRHKRLLTQRTIAWILGALAVLCAIIAVWKNSQPIDVEVNLNEECASNTYLPPLKNAIVTMGLDNESKRDTLKTLETALTFTNVPHRFKNKKVNVHFECQNYQPLDTIILLQDYIVINIRREPTVFGKVRFRLWNQKTERTSTSTEIIVNGYSVISDENGYVALDIPLEEQRPEYTLESSIKLKETILHMPCGPNDIVLFE